MGDFEQSAVDCFESIAWEAEFVARFAGEVIALDINGDGCDGDLGVVEFVEAVEFGEG